MDDKNQASTHRVLIVDDNPAIHEDIRKILKKERADTALDSLSAEVFGEVESGPENDRDFELDSAMQGQAAHEMVQDAVAEGRPYELAFVDMRMPPGWDGVETIAHLWEVDPEIQIVICTAYSDRSWEEIVERLGSSDRLLVLKKPFDSIEIVQIAHALTEKWRVERRIQSKLDDLDTMVATRTAELNEAMAKLKDEMAERERMEAELRLAQKLEAVGQLAAGIAHEINTPVQYISDSVRFLKSGVEDLWSVVSKGEEAVSILEQVNGHDSFRAEMVAAFQDADVDYLKENMPEAFQTSLDGLSRVADIVRAMKEFSHPDVRTKSASDLNRALSNTLTVASNEYRYVAEIATDFAELPPVVCHVGDLNQVFLNLIVNAAHAIADRVGDSGEKGTITLSTRVDADHVEVCIADDGGGIPEGVRDRVFDPFFTTKEVGRGTGQGLAIARSIVVDKHGGTLEFDTEVGRGTTFRIRIPTGVGTESSAGAAA